MIKIDPAFDKPLHLLAKLRTMADAKWGPIRLWSIRVEMGPLLTAAAFIIGVFWLIFSVERAGHVQTANDLPTPQLSGSGTVELEISQNGNIDVRQALSLEADRLLSRTQYLLLNRTAELIGGPTAIAVQQNGNPLPLQYAFFDRLAFTLETQDQPAQIDLEISYTLTPRWRQQETGQTRSFHLILPENLDLQEQTHTTRWIDATGITQMDRVETNLYVTRRGFSDFITLQSMQKTNFPTLFQAEQSDEKWLWVIGAVLVAVLGYVLLKLALTGRLKGRFINPSKDNAQHMLSPSIATLVDAMAQGEAPKHSSLLPLASLADRGLIRLERNSHQKGPQGTSWGTIHTIAENIPPLPREEAELLERIQHAATDGQMQIFHPSQDVGESLLVLQDTRLPPLNDSIFKRAKSMLPNLALVTPVIVAWLACVRSETAHTSFDFASSLMDVMANSVYLILFLVAFILFPMASFPYSMIANLFIKKKQLHPVEME
ncbi:MAG: hypothetical protein Alpg2KO_11570 [Alphaproteobacteria bacterium]